MFSCKLRPTEEIKQLLTEDLSNIFGVLLVSYFAATLVGGGSAWYEYWQGNELSLFEDILRYSWFGWFVGIIVVWLQNRMCEG